jgi:hypothetical protein
MIDLDHFVKDLGPNAKHYTREQLAQLHGEVRKLANLLLAAQKAKTDRKNSYPQHRLDGTAADRIVKKTVTGHVEGGDPSRGP